jgi:glucuronate isomerase
MLDPDRLLPPEPGVRRLARSLYERTRALPIVSPHGHVDAAALADDAPIGDPAAELVTRDHYLLRMLYSQGVPLEALGARPNDDGAEVADGRSTWRTLAEHYHLFRATPSKLWFDHTLAEVFGVTEPLVAGNADEVYDHLAARLADDDFRPRALFDRFGIEWLATTDASLDDLDAHARIRTSGWEGRVVPTFRPDDVVDPDRSDFGANLDRLAKVTGEDTATWDGYLAALRIRRAAFIEAGATASDHGHPSAAAFDLPRAEIESLFRRVRAGGAEPGDAERFRGQLLVEMAAMSLDDGLVLQLHAGSWRGHNPTLAARFGPDKGADIPRPMDYVGALKPLLDRFGNEPSLTVVIYTLDESAYSRELAPLAGHYPALRLGPPWWFHDSPEGIRRFRGLVTETAGFANTVGFNDDARSLLSIPARHDMARRLDAGFLAGLVAEGRLRDDEAAEVAEDLADGLARRAFKVP